MFPSIFVLILGEFFSLFFQTCSCFKNSLDESEHKLNKIWVDQGNEFYNRSMKTWLQDNDIKIYSTQSEEKYVVAKIFTRILNTKIYEHITPVSKNVYINKLDEIVEKSNTHHRKRGYLY